MTTISVPLIVRRRIQAPRPRVFEAFTSAAALSKWFVPDAAVTLDVEEFAFAVGGRYRLRYTMPDARQAVVGGVYEVIVAPERIVLTWVWEAPDPLAGIPMRVTFAFEAHGAETEVTVTHEGIPSDAACTVHEAGWDGAMHSLAAYLGTSRS